MAQSGKPISEIGFDKLADRFQIVLNSDDDNGENVNKPDFRELDLGSPISPLRTHGLATATSSSSSSSGSVTLRNFPSPVSKRSDSGWNNHSGELSVESSPSNSGFKPGHARSNSSGSHPLIYSGGGSSLISPAVNVLPSGNICPTGKFLNSGMASRSLKIDVLGSGTGNYGHGSIMRGGATSKFGGRGSGSDCVVSGGAYPKGLVGVEAVKRAIWSNDPEELKRIGNEHYKKGHFAEALNLYDKAIAISPGNAAYHCNRAAALIGLKLLAEAVRECEEAIRLDPRYVRAHRRLGSLFLSLGQVENARIHLCLRGKESDPAELQKLQLIDWHLSKCTDARKVGDWRSALRQVDAAIASGAFYSPQLFACRAEAHMKLHQLEDADFTLAHIPKLETYTPSFSKAKIFGMLSEAYILFVQAQVDMAHGRFENALTAAEKAVHIDPRNVELSVLINNARLVGRARVRGNDLFKSERFTEACSAYSDGLRLDPSNAVLYCNRAACWYKLGQWERSIDDCNQALRIQPNYTKAILRRAASNSKLECWADAVRDYEILRKELPSDKDVAESLFHAQVALKKSCGEEVYNMKFGGEVESVSRLEQFRSAISSPCASVVHFKVSSNLQCKQISPFLDTLCSQYPSINFLKVDVEECPAIANDENVRIVPTFKIYRKGVRVKEMICPSREVLESSVRHYS